MLTLSIATGKRDPFAVGAPILNETRVPDSCEATSGNGFACRSYPTTSNARFFKIFCFWALRFEDFTRYPFVTATF
jgi:hypothetical protein